MRSRGRHHIRRARWNLESLARNPNVGGTPLGAMLGVAGLFAVLFIIVVGVVAG